MEKAVKLFLGKANTRSEQKVIWEVNRVLMENTVSGSTTESFSAHRKGNLSYSLE